MKTLIMAGSILNSFFHILPMQWLDADYLTDFVTQRMNWMGLRDHIFRKTDRKFLGTAEKSMRSDGTAMAEKIT